ncbi:HK97 gp10 family phage protein [Mycobacterium gordonae]|nr:HK97 gp10 family phage protein [Mycobacterium gordonae]
MTEFFKITFNGLSELRDLAEQRQRLILANAQMAVRNTVLYGIGLIMKNTPVDTGLLRASIGGEFGGGPAKEKEQTLTFIEGLTGAIGTSVEYAIYVEYGHQLAMPRTAKQKKMAYLFAVGILKRKPGGGIQYSKRAKLVRAGFGGGGTNFALHAAINRRAGVRGRVKGRGMFRKNMPLIRAYFEASMQAAVRQGLAGQTYVSLEGAS